MSLLTAMQQVVPGQKKQILVGLAGICATCRQYQKASASATEKRREQAKESVQLSQKLTTSSITSVQFTKDHCAKPIAHCEPKAKFTGKSKAPINVVNLSSIRVSVVTGASAFSALLDSDVANGRCHQRQL
ncbi:uncharacterized protein EDB91DRAFT_1086779 [Suillus paluster]|uniref:uncharacterized protein n=1 Tax=Suillus paluster TaxID=48578 RepID=UPI001B8779ED|nr:uncharacterized protein EDB91DRAFT_1086779 [Suillus paluster]KAG1726422.1 hypothetical protein EDB91DRAFT_1086779 [Suillus paluster]